VTADVRPVESFPIERGGFGIGPLKVDLPARFIPNVEETP
jgi:hypothetical protein